MLATKLVMYRSNRSFNMPPTRPGIPRAFDTFAVPGRREFDYQSLPGGGEFELHPQSHVLYYYMRNFCNLIGLEQWSFSLI